MTATADIVFRVLMAGVAAVGLGDSLIFAYNAWHNKETEVTCKDGSCVRLSKTPYARVFFNIPNWAFGIPYYAITVLAAIIAKPWIVAPAALGAIISTLLSFYLIYTLVIKLKVICRLCYLAHAVNIVLFAMWIVAGATG
ncbi:MAG TPA: vitamin K epoxide reductase family protein [Verrucomicrobiae bacterium]|nr:vitamin K epoxide reductase family protein [Verrucomicrobiae bacterium]